MDVVGYEENGTQHNGGGEIHFGWVLEGRAIQDVWMIPRRAERRPASRDAGHRQLLRHDAARLRSRHRCLAHPVERSDAPVLHAPDRPRARRRHRAGRPRNDAAGSCAGASPRSRRTRSTGSASARPTTAPAGGCRSRCSPAASARGEAHACLRSSNSIEMPSGPRMKHTRTPGRTVVGSRVNSTPLALRSAAMASMPLTVSPK